jgi:tetratricopeptide (TPR) repeat protein
MAGKAKTTETKKSEGMSLLLRMEGFFFKLKKSMDGLVDFYCRLTRIESVEARNLVSRKADSLMSKGRYGKAIDQYNILIRMGKEDPAIYYNLGHCCEHEGMDEEAEKAYKKAFELDKTSADAVYRLGLLAIKNEDPKTAVRYLSALTNKNNKSFDVLYNLGVAHDKLKDFEKAVESFKKAIAIEPAYSKVHKRLGYTYEAIGEHEEAMECFKKAMELEEI